jgi:uncharacterized integral membrane protein
MFSLEEHKMTWVCISSEILLILFFLILLIQLTYDPHSAIPDGREWESRVTLILA